MTFAIAGLLFLLGLLATMPLFAWVAKRTGRRRDEDVARRPASLLLGFWLRDWLVWLIRPVERSLVTAGISPTALNLLGAVCGIAGGGAFATGQFGLAAWLVGLGGFSDILDGRVARARGIASAYGAFLDSTLDRFAETGTFVGIAWYFAGSAWLSAATVLAIAGSLLVSYTRARGEALGVHFAGGLMQRAERLTLLAVGALLDAPLSQRLGWSPGAVLSGVVVAIGVGTVGTAIYRTARIAQALASNTPGRAE